MKGGTFYGNPEDKPEGYDHTNVENFKTLCGSNAEPIIINNGENVPIENRVSFMENGKLYCFEKNALIKWLKINPTNPITHNIVSQQILDQLGIENINPYFANRIPQGTGVNNNISSVGEAEKEIVYSENSFDDWVKELKLEEAKAKWEKRNADEAALSTANSSSSNNEALNFEVYDDMVYPMDTDGGKKRIKKSSKKMDKNNNKKGGTFYGNPEDRPADYDHTNVEKFKELCGTVEDPIGREKWEEISPENRVSITERSGDETWLHCFEKESLITWLRINPINPNTRTRVNDDVLRQFGIPITNIYYDNEDILPRQNALTADEIEAINTAYIIDNLENRNINDQPIIPSPVPQAPILEPVEVSGELMDEINDDEFTL